MARLGALLKEFTQSASPTSGITSYGNTGKRKVRLRPGTTLQRLLKGFNADQPRDDRGRWSTDDGSSSKQLIDPHHLARLSPEAAAQLVAMYEKAADAKPGFDKALTAIAKDFEGVAKLPALKGSDRATNKIATELKGDSSGLRDLLRGTVEVKTVEEAQKALAAAREQFEVLPTGFRNALTPEANPPDGYRDIKMNVRMPNGLVAEVQINLPGMLAAKAANHGLYEERQAIEAKIGDRHATPEETAAIAALNGQMKSAYDKAWKAAGGG